MTIKEKLGVISLMKECKLPEYMIDEYEEANFLPYKKETLNLLLAFCNRAERITLVSLGYDENIINSLNNFYSAI